ncbi:MAG: hypothetical protein M3Q85_08485 [Acidobacteriota bacterium]|nr:hypothetical protein [Acidobacteriota bacterium]
MPLYLTQWRSGDVSLTAANSRDEALNTFGKVGCLDSWDVYELKANELRLDLTLTDEGALVLNNYDETVEELLQVCFPELVPAMKGYPSEILPRELRPVIKKIVRDALKLRRESKLSAKLRREGKRKKQLQPRMLKGENWAGTANAARTPGHESNRAPGSRTGAPVLSGPSDL